MLLKIFLYMIAAGFAFFLITFAFMLLLIDREAKSLPTGDETVMVVLGSGLTDGNRVSVTLGLRLDTAFRYYSGHPDVIIVTSGGQGDDETVSEAFAMKGYLAAKGVPDEKILTEERSRNTRQNLEYSKQVMDENRLEGKIIIVTNRFHCYRSGLYAKKAGLEAASLPAPDRGFFVSAYNYLREYGCLGWYIVFDR